MSPEWAVFALWLLGVVSGTVAGAGTYRAAVYAMARKVRRRHTDSRGSCSLWVNVRYIEPWGAPTWAVVVYTFEYEVEVARSPSLLVALWKALAATNRGAGTARDAQEVDG